MSTSPLGETVSLPSTPTPSTVGRFFRGLRVHSRLGEGAMGEAFLASHPVLRVPVVIKLFKMLESGVSPLGEAHLAARVTSPHVVDVLDAGVEGEMPFIVHRYVDGIDLDELLSLVRGAGRKLPPSFACRAIIDAANGLHASHQAGVVHLDVKPANLFVNGDGCVEVGDFGIAREARAQRRETSVRGTPSFMAPELWQGEPVDRRADVYALGCSLHLLLTGALPFDAASLVELSAAHVHRPYEPPRASSPREAYAFAVVERAMRKAPGDRYPTAEALADELSVIAEPSPSYRVMTHDHARVGQLSLTLALGDLTREEATVIVNAANVGLSMSLGVARALREAGGDEIEREAEKSAPAAMGDVVFTGAGRLRARWVAHAIAASEGAICLQRSAMRALLRADALGASSVAMPALGTGIGDVPLELGAKLLLEAVRTVASIEPRNLRSVRLVLRDEAAFASFCEVLSAM